MDLPNDNTHIPELEKLSGYLTELESALSCFWNMEPSLKCIAKDGKFLKVNQAWTTTLGYSKQFLLETPYRQLIHPDDLADTSLIEHKLKDNKTVTNFTNRYRHIDGHYVTLKWVATEDVKSGIIYASATDISEHIQQGVNIKLLTESERVKATVLDRCNFSVVITDALQPDNPIVYVNKAFTLITGYSPNEAIGNNPRFLHAEAVSGDQGHAAIREAVERGKPYAGIVLNRRKDGTFWYNQIIITPIYDTNKRVTHFVGIGQDVTPHVGSFGDSD